MIYEFVSPLKTNIKQFTMLFQIFDKYMCKLGYKGLAVYLKDEILKKSIQTIYLTPIIQEHRVVLNTRVICYAPLTEIQIGILKDYIESEFIYHVDKYFKANNIDIRVYNEHTFYLHNKTSL